MIIRKFKKDQDILASLCIYKEVGWVDDIQSELNQDIIASYLKDGNTNVAELNGTAEALATITPVTVKYLKKQLDASMLTGTLTSNIARQQGLATILVATSLAQEAEKGKDIAIVDFFDQGYYNRFGFGNGPYVNTVRFDPASLKVAKKHRIPSRLTLDDYQLMFNARKKRIKYHGALDFLSPLITKLNCKEKESFGLGYFDNNGQELTHYFWGEKNGEFGPLNINALVYQNKEQLLELLSLIKSFSDQVLCVEMKEPIEIHFQDLLEKPFRHIDTTEGSSFYNKISTASEWQIRILNLQSAIRKTKWNGEPLSFNLLLTDPIEKLCDTNFLWKGVSGEYIIHFGEKSSIKKGNDSTLLKMETDINTFSRMWFGVASCSSLYMTEDIIANEMLMEKLDTGLHMVEPHLDWSF